MKKVYGLDVHKDTILLCILAGNGQTISKEFGTLTAAALVGRAGLRPRNDESAKKIKSGSGSWHGGGIYREKIVKISDFY